MKKMYSIFTVLILLCSSNTAFSQGFFETLQKKYWYYRARLVNDFIIEIGPDPGFSLPANERQFIYCPTCEETKLTWGDAGIHLATYITILATEYALLTIDGQNTNETLRELFYAIEAINRLDYHAEICFTDPNTGLPGQNELNGFFIRDDVAGISPQAYNSLNTNPNLHEVTAFTSDFTSEVIRNKEESQDQVIFLLMALTAVDRWVPEGVSFGSMQFMDGETELKQEARNIADRIMSYVHSTSQWYYSDWIIRNPVTGEAVLRGSEAWPFSWGLAKAHYAISQFNHAGSSSTNGQLAQSEWTALQLPGAFLYKEQKLASILAAIGKSWGDLTMSYVDMKSYPLDPWDKWTFEWIPLVGPLTRYDEQGFESRVDEMLLILDEAPCHGPFKTLLYPYWTPDYANDNWSTQSRYLHPENMEPEPDTEYFGEFSGLGYMLMYNLFRIGYRNDISFPPYINYKNYITSRDMAYLYEGYPNGIIGTSTSPKYEISNKDINSKNIVENGGNLILVAGEEITLAAPFWAKQGSQFNAYIDEGLEDNYDCDYYKTSQNTLLLNEKSNINLSQHDNIPISSVQIYPNPSIDGRINVLSSEEIIQSIQLRNIAGQIVYIKSNSNSNEEYLEISKKGLYTIDIIFKDKIVTKKIVIQ